MSKSIEDVVVKAPGPTAAPKLIKAQGGRSVSFTYNVVPKRPLLALLRSSLLAEGVKHRIWIDSEGRAFAVPDGIDPNDD